MQLDLILFVFESELGLLVVNFFKVEKEVLVDLADRLRIVNPTTIRRSHQLLTDLDICGNVFPFLLRNYLPEAAP